MEGVNPASSISLFSNLFLLGEHSLSFKLSTNPLSKNRKKMLPL